MPLLAVILALAFAAPQAALPPVPHNFQIMAEVQRDISSRKMKAGDAVTLLCTDEIASATNLVYLPAGARLTATVTAAQKHSGTQPGELALHLTAADWKGGHA